MFDYLQKFNNLPQDLRDRVSSPSALALMSELENKYRTDLAMVVMKVMIKSLLPQNLPAYFTGEAGLAPDAAAALTRELKEKILAPVADYLGLSAEKRAWDLDKDIDAFIKEAGLVLPSAVLVGRFKNILATYLRGVRSKIDTRNSLSKDVKIGGLNLSAAEIDRVLKISESHHFVNLELKPGASAGAPTAAAAPAARTMAAARTATVPSARLDKIMRAADKSGEYDLKQSLAKGQALKISAPAAQLDLPAVGRKPAVSAPVPGAAAPKVSAAAAPVMKAAVSKTAVSPAASPAATQLPPLRSVAPHVVAAASVSHPASAPVVRPAAVKSAAPTARPAAAPAVKPAPAAIRPALSASASRPPMHDIKAVPKVMGPVEELQFLDLVNFRRLGATPAEITAKILGKIKLLEKDGYDKMVAGVRAWRQSPVNRLYLRLGQEAVAKGLPFKDAIAARQAANQEYLNLSEVEAIVSLNSQLMF